MAIDSCEQLARDYVEALEKIVKLMELALKNNKTII